MKYKEYLTKFFEYFTQVNVNSDYNDDGSYMHLIKDRHVIFKDGSKIFWIAFIVSIFILFFLPSFIFLLVIILISVVSSGFTIIQPNEAKVIIFLGKYIGTIKSSGFFFTIPFSVKKTISLKLVNFVTDRLKVNDKNGNPVEIGAVIVWRVVDAAQACFNIDNYISFVTNQSDIAIRAIAAHYAYDSEKDVSLRGNLDEIAAKLKNILQEKLTLAGIIVEEARLTHLAYAQEVASSMLKRQQAVAILESRQYMVENALAIIEDVIKHLENNITLSDDKKAELINSLLIVMVSDKEATPVLSISK